MRNVFLNSFQSWAERAATEGGHACEMRGNWVVIDAGDGPQTCMSVARVLEVLGHV